MIPPPLITPLPTHRRFSPSSVGVCLPVRLPFPSDVPLQVLLRPFASVPPPFLPFADFVPRIVVPKTLLRSSDWQRSSEIAGGSADFGVVRRTENFGAHWENL